MLRLTGAIRGLDCCDVLAGSGNSKTSCHSVIQLSRCKMIPIYQIMKGGCFTGDENNFHWPSRGRLSRLRIVMMQGEDNDFKDKDDEDCAIQVASK